jgi:hypothetical protein
MTKEMDTCEENLQSATDLLKTDQNIATQEDLDFLAYLIEMALKEASDQLQLNSGRQGSKVVNLIRN